MTGTGGLGCLFFFEESSDRDGWADCSGASGGEDPGPNNEVQVPLTFSKRWFRMSVVLGGTDPGVTCWAQGFLVNRET